MNNFPWEELHDSCQKLDFKDNLCWDPYLFKDNQNFELSKFYFEGLKPLGNAKIVGDKDIPRRGDFAVGFYLPNDVERNAIIHVNTPNGVLNTKIAISPGEFVYCLNGTHVVSLLHNPFNKIGITVEPCELTNKVQIVYAILNDRYRKGNMQLYYNMNDCLYIGNNGFNKLDKPLNEEPKMVIPNMNDFNRKYKNIMEEIKQGQGRIHKTQNQKVTMKDMTDFNQKFKWVMEEIKQGSENIHKPVNQTENVTNLKVNSKVSSLISKFEKH